MRELELAMGSAALGSFHWAPGGYRARLIAMVVTLLCEATEAASQGDELEDTELVRLLGDMILRTSPCCRSIMGCVRGHILSASGRCCGVWCDCVAMRACALCCVLALFMLGM